MTSRYDAVSFDVGHTLLKYATPNYVCWAKALAPIGGPTSESLASALQAVLGGWQTPPGTRETQEQHDAEWSAIYRRVLDAAGFSGDSEEAVGLMWHAWIHDVWEPYEEVHDVLTRLRTCNLRLAVLSNWSPTLGMTLEGQGLSGYFDAVVCSAAVGCAKPDRAIFEELVRTLCMPPDRILHVGDSYDTDVVGATAIGMGAVLLDRAGEELVDYHPTIRSLSEFVDLLG